MMDKIIKMLSSKDDEMAILGATLAIKQGLNWCKKYIPSFGPTGWGGGMLTYRGESAMIITDGTITIYMSTISRSIDARKSEDFSSSLYQTVKRIKI